MSPSFLPDVRGLRAPLTAGAVWLIAGWIVFARHWPRKAEATGFAADAHTAAAFLGTAGTLAFLAVVAYGVGTLWMIGRIPLIRGLRSAVWHCSGGRWSVPPLAPSRRFGIEGVFTRLLTQPRGDHHSLFAVMGIAEPKGALGHDDIHFDLLHAATADYHAFDAAMCEDHPQLWHRWDQSRLEALWADVLAFPVACCVNVLAFALWPAWYGAVFGALAGAAAWFLLRVAEGLLKRAAWSTLFEAVALGKYAAPALRKCALEQFGPASPPGSDGA